jgi:hypothetical protein
MPQGPQPVITIIRAGGLESILASHDITVRSKGEYSLIKHSQRSQHGTRNLVECSNRGECDYDTGVCTCFEGFRSSDGNGGNGTIGDCGYRYQPEAEYTYDGVTYQTNCPVGPNNRICSGNGTCDVNTGMCTCFTGYGMFTYCFFFCIFGC